MMKKTKKLISEKDMPSIFISSNICDIFVFIKKIDLDPFFFLEIYEMREI